MSFDSIMFNIRASKSDRLRDEAIPLPLGVTEHRDIAYGPHGKSNLLDVYYPEGTTQPLPTIVSIHGGGYVYGSKEIYRRYGMDMAKRGFAFVNFNYRLAPRWKFPTPLHDTNSVLEWVCKNAARYHLDPSRIILLGDSAGAQLTSQYATIFTNPEYAKLFQLRLPPVSIRCVGLFCGMYDMVERVSGKRKGIILDYIGRKLSVDDPRFAVLQNITPSFPPAFIATGTDDFLRPCAEPMYQFLQEKGVASQWHCYSNENGDPVYHVFHVIINSPIAIACNDDAAEFFRQYV